MDNCSSHVSDKVTEKLKENSISYLHLAPYTTPICQPVDIQVGAMIKGKIKYYFEEWLMENMENETLISYDEKKKKYRFVSPNRDQIVKWVLRAYDEVDRGRIKESKIFSQYFFFH